MDAFVKQANRLFHCSCTFPWALARVSCNHVIKCAAWSPEQCIYTLSSAGTGIPIRVCLYQPPYGASSLVFCCHGALEVHQTQVSNLFTAYFYSSVTFLSLANQISHTWLHHTKEQQQPQAHVALQTALSGKLGFKNGISVIVVKSSLSLEGEIWF